MKPGQTPEQLGKYKILGALGRGAMGVVYKAHDPSIDRIVALKTILKGRLDAENQQAALARFQREAQAAGRLHHPNIVSVFDYVEEGSIAFIVMEYMEGIDLKHYIGRRGRLQATEAVIIVKQMLAALNFAHDRGVVHRDIKPANVFVVRGGTVKIGDFGIAKLDTDANLTQAGTIMGTPYYMSPEHFQGTRVDNRSDLFSLGVMFYELLTGQRPFTGSLPSVMHKVLTLNPPPPSECDPSLPGALDRVALKAIAKKPEDRYQRASDFSDDLIAAFTRRAESGARSTPTAGGLVAEMAASVDSDSVQQDDDLGIEAMRASLREILGESGPQPEETPESDAETALADRETPGTFIVSEFGDDDFSSIQEAVKQAPPHSEILIEPGIYRESIVMDKPLTLAGSGPLATIIIESDRAPCLQVLSERGSIRGLTIRGKASGSNQAALDIGMGRVRISDCDITSDSDHCVAVHGIRSRPLIEGCRIHGGAGYGLSFYGKGGGTVRNCSIFGNQAAGIAIAGGCAPTIEDEQINDTVARHKGPLPRPGGASAAGRGRRGERHSFDNVSSDQLGGALRGAGAGVLLALLFLLSGQSAIATHGATLVGLTLGFMQGRAIGLLIGFFVGILLSGLNPLSLSLDLLPFLNLGSGSQNPVLSAFDLALRSLLAGALTWSLAAAAEQMIMQPADRE